ncbi:MAG: rhomboid family intramembrane serine protease, partial [Myxococcota bacterium]
MSASERYLRVVEHLLSDAPSGRVLLRIEDTAAFVAMEDASLAIVIRPTKRGDELRAAIEEQLRKNARAHHKLVIVGGDAQMQAILTACQPGIFSRRMVKVYHLGDDGTVWGGRASRVDSPMGRALQAAATMDADASVDVEALVAKTYVPTKAEAEAAVEQRTFVKRYQGVRPVVTIGATGLILGVFGLQVTWGGPEFLPSLVRMGANMGAAVATEPWRLLSSALLHGNLIHVAMNAFVLYVLGAHLERILGWRRMVLLLVAAALGGGIASALFMDAQVSVGASGAIWGLLGGALGLALRPGTLVPAPQVAALKRAALINLVLNVSVSFMPGIDFMAHLGGGVVGLALTGSGLLTRKLAPFVEDPERTTDAHPRLTASAHAATALTVGTLVAAIVVGRPWTLSGRP